MLETRLTDYTLTSLGQFGERARPIKAELQEAALIIGLGQVGLHAVARTHDMLDAMLSARERQSNIRMLAIHRQRSIREETVLPREERLVLSLDLPAWSDVPGRYAQLGVAQWWPHSPRAREVQADPTLVRAYSRLMLFDNAALVSETLYKLMRWVQDVGTGRNLQLKRRVYILASLAESESSGMLFDVVSRLRALATPKPTEIIGVFSLRAFNNPADPDNTLAMANVYAALREIDAYTLHPDAFPSTLPVIGHTLDRAKSPRALDTILLTDDAASDTQEPPETALAEFVTTWIAASLLPPEQAPPLPQPVALEKGVDRFGGYSTFGVSKLALPTRAAMDLAAVGLSQATLRAVKSAHAAMPTSDWVNGIAADARRAVLESDVLKTGEVLDRLRDWQFEFSAAGLTRKQEIRQTRGEPSRMTELVQAEWRRLERESVGEFAVEGTTAATPDTLRYRIDTRLGVHMRELRASMQAAPVELAYAQGYGLIWTVSALEKLHQEMLRTAQALQGRITEAQAGYQNAHAAVFQAAQQHDAKSGARLSGSRKAVVAELESCAEAALNAAVRLIETQARADAWQGLVALVADLREQVRDVLAQVDQASRALSEFETAARQAMEQAAAQPPAFPAGVALTEDWYVSGIRSLANVGQLPPRELLQRVYTAWKPPSDLLPERKLVRFLADIRQASRRTLATAFQFADLYEFLSQNEDKPAFKQALTILPNAATPAMTPLVDDKHGAPAPFEIVREVKRPFSALSPVQQGITRGFVPSPDPDEILVLRLLHGVMAEALPPLREAYRRAYDRAGAEGMPLHVDRRWDSTMADLVHTSARREISIIWERMMDALPKHPHTMQQPLDALVRALSIALDVEGTATAPNLPPDLRLVLFKLRPFRLKLPPPNCPMMFVYSHRAAEELAEDIFRAITPLPMEEQFAFVVNVSGRPDMEQIVESLRRVDFTVLVLDEAAIKHLVSARLPTRALSDLVLNQVSLTTVSPFFTRGPVPEHMFFGREREINEVRSKLRTHSVALIGGRRIGKTSTLQRIQRLLEPEESEYVPYYLDCHGATNYQSFFWLINRRWNVAIKQDAKPVEFEDVITALQAKHPGKNIVVLLDEVDSLLNFDRQTENQETLFRTFRSLSNEKRCQYVFSGEKWLMRAITNPYSALFNFAQVVRLEPLPPKVVHHLVADPSEMLNIWMEQSDQVIERIYQISAGHPNIVQMICQAMIEELDQDPSNANLINFEHLDKATSRRTLQEEIVQTIWGQMNPLARLITLIWPEGERYLSLKQIEAALAKIGLPSIPPERMERTAKDLELYCFVRPTNGDRLELIPMAFPAILDFMTDKRRQIDIVRRHYEADPDGNIPPR